MKKAIICDLIVWMEKNLTQPLSLTHIADRAGYTKWHLQRSFKEITGQTLFSYVQGRRLSRAAVELRLTNRSIIDVAIEYRFESQQTFTRAFKKRFLLTPRIYRCRREWNMFGINPPLFLHIERRAQPEFFTLLLRHQAFMSQCRQLSPMAKPPAGMAGS